MALIAVAFLGAAGIGQQIPTAAPQPEVVAIAAAVPSDRLKALIALREKRTAIARELCTQIKETKPDEDYFGRLNLLITAAADWRAEEAIDPLIPLLELRLDKSTFPRGSRSDPISLFPAAGALGRIAGPVVVEKILIHAQTEANENNLRLCAYVLNECCDRNREATAAFLATYPGRTETSAQKSSLTKMIEILKKVDTGILPT